MIQTFKDKQEQNLTLAEQSKRQINWLSWLRVSVFLISLILFYLTLRNDALELLILVILIGVGLFVFLVKLQNLHKEKFAIYNAISQINQEEIDRKDGEFGGLYDAEIFLDEHHPYAYDLDIFGAHSLYQLVNRSTTHSGRVFVAQNLLSTPPANDIYKRQEAIKELKEAIDWRQSFQAYGIVHRTDEKNEKALQEWLKREFLSISKRKYKNIASVFTFLSIAAFVMLIAGVITYHFVLLILVINAFILLPHIKKINEWAAELSGSEKLLYAYADMSGMIERQEWNSVFLLDKQEKLKSKEFYASSHIRKLKKLMEFFNDRGNMMYQMFNAFFLLDIHLVYSIEKWKAKHSHEINQWINAISEIELTGSLAAFSYANPNYAFPKLVEDDIVVKGDNIGHPLIVEKDRVCNDFKIKNKGSIALITGSNMAGKSTFLRTIGVNLILAQLGSPVCADEFIFCPCKVFTSMRTKDNLNESISSFYAELLRIKALLDSIDDDQTTFFLLDEILKGTNSHDRHQGAISLIKQLSKQNAFGLVSTHDLELGTLGSEVKGLENYSFESQIKGDEIFFDYKLMKGLCKSFNASKLMEKMGIEMENG